MQSNCAGSTTAPPNEQEKRRSILQTLLGTCSPMTGIEPDFHCDYGFNIHTHGLAVINYNCVILDTSPVNIGEGLILAVPSDIKNSAVNTFMWNQQTSETSV